MNLGDILANIIGGANPGLPPMSLTGQQKAQMLMAARNDPSAAHPWAETETPAVKPAAIPPDATPTPPVMPPVTPPTVSPNDAGPDVTATPEPSPMTLTPPIADAYKSPPDLVNMYMKIMERSENAARLDRGLTLIAAGLAHDENRNALIQAAFRGGGGGSAGPLSLDDLIKLQKMQESQDAANRQTALLPALQEKYGFDPATIQYLNSTGQLDEVIKELAVPTTEVIKDHDGSQRLINKTSGETIRQLSPKAPRETLYIPDPEGTGGQVLIYKDDNTRVDNGKKITSIKPEVKTQIVHDDSDGSNKLFDLTNGKVLGVVTGPKKDQLKRADGSVALIDSDGNVLKELSPAAEAPVTIEKLSNGQLQAYQKGKPVGDPMGPETPPPTTDDIKEWKQISLQRAAANEPPISLEQWILQSNKSKATQVNLGPTGVDYGPPPKGQVWVRDKEGNVVTEADGAPKTVWIKSSPEYAEHLRQEAEEARKAGKAGTEAATAAETAATAEAHDYLGNFAIGRESDRAVKLIDAGEEKPFFGNTGWGYMLFSGLPGEQRDLKNAIETIKSNITVQELENMRRASPTGGALGNITEKEEAMLGRLFGAIDPVGDPAIAREQILQFKEAVRLMTSGIPDPTAPKGRRFPTEAELGDLMRKAGMDTRVKKLPDGGTLQRIE